MKELIRKKTWPYDHKASIEKSDVLEASHSALKSSSLLVPSYTARVTFDFTDASGRKLAYNWCLDHKEVHSEYLGKKTTQLEILGHLHLCAIVFTLLEPLAPSFFLAGHCLSP